MAKSWPEVVGSDEYATADNATKDAIRQQYFTQIIAPQVPKEKLDDVRKAFLSSTSIRDTTRPAPQDNYDPTEGMSGLNKFVAAYGGAIPTLARGVGQALGLVSDADVAEAKRLDAPLLRTGAGMAGNIAGNIAAAAPAAFVPGANSMLGAAGVGALYGAAQPTVAGDSRLTNALEGGAMAGGLTGAMRAAPGVYNALVAPFTEGGQTKIALNTLARFAQDPNAVAGVNTNSLRELVQGSRPTLAEVTGDPGIAQLQRTLASKSPEAASVFSDTTVARNKARMDVLRDIAGDPAQREFYAASRDTAAKELYEKAFTEVPTPTPWIKGQITQLQSRPAFQDAVKEAQTLAKNEGLKLDSDNVVQVLHYTKMALDDQIANATGNAQRALIGTRDKLVTLMESKDFAPSYREARDTFKQMSKPINQMDVGQTILDKASSALQKSDGESTLYPEAFARALRSGEQTVKTATGFKGNKGLESVFTPQQMDAVNNVAKDLARVAQADQAGAITGSRTAQYQAGQNIMRQMLGIGLPQKWAEFVSTSLLADVTANRLMTAAAEPLEKRIQLRLAQLLIDPREAVRAQRAINASRAVPASEFARIATPSAAIGVGSYSAQQ